MTQEQSPITVALLAAPATSAGTLYSFHDALSSVRRDWQFLHGRDAVASPFTPMIVSRDGAPILGANDVRIVADRSFADCPAPQIVVITNLVVSPVEPLGPEYDAEVEWLRHCYASGSVIACVCSGAALLARTGLLDGQEATSHWAYCDALARRHPTTRWHPERGLVTAGEDGRLVMSGSGVMWHMLILALIARFSSPEEAMQVARIDLMDMNATSPIAYASLKHGAAAGDPLIERCQVWVANNYQVESPVAQMVAMSGLPERTFKRRFTQATGMSPLDYVHVVRLEEAKQMLESTDEPVESIAGAVGYQDASFFSRLFRRKVSLTPAQYRRRFSTLGRHLRASKDPGGRSLQR